MQGGREPDPREGREDGRGSGGQARFGGDGWGLWVDTEAPGLPGLRTPPGWLNCVSFC